MRFNHRISIVFAIAVLALISGCESQTGPVTAQRDIPADSPTPAAQKVDAPQTATKTEFTPIPPNMVSRQGWKAKIPVGEAKTHVIKFITVHHTATAQKTGTAIENKMQSLQNFSQSESRLESGKLKPAWFDVPYHYYIAVDGRIAEGREIKFVGDTNTEYDPTGHALVVLEGNFENEKPSPLQIVSLRAMTHWLTLEYKVEATDIKAHNDYAQTACPGTNLKALMPELRNYILAGKAKPIN